MATALPLFAGLVMATPLTRMARVRSKCSSDCLVIWLVQAFGVVARA